MAEPDDNEDFSGRLIASYRAHESRSVGKHGMRRPAPARTR